jgi:hypothetical protein
METPSFGDELEDSVLERLFGEGVDSTVDEIVA